MTMQPGQVLLRWAIGAIVVSLLLACALYWAVSLRAQSGLSSSQTGIGVDPLTAAEAELALESARSTGEMAALQSADSSQVTNTLTAPTQELLLVERSPIDKNAATSQSRQGAVYVYDYTTDELIYSVVDVATGALVEQERVQGVQLPLTQAEEARTIAIAWGDAPTHEALTQEFQRVTGQPLIGLDQLQVKASILLADSLPQRLNAAAQACGVQRCAQLLLFSVDKVAFEMLPVVSLSQGTVLQAKLLEQEN